MQKVHGVHSKRSPEAWQSAQLRIEQSRQHEVSYRKCKAVKGHAVRSRALASEGLRQMAACDGPNEYMAVQARWSAAQQVSNDVKWFDSLDVQLNDADEEEDDAMAEVAELVGAADVMSMAAIGQEGLRPPAAPGSGGGGSRAVVRGTNSSTMQMLLQELRQEPKDEAECTAKFLLYEGYGSEVEDMRNTLFKFYEESRPTVPAVILTDMDRQVKGIDSTEAMGIPDRAREWFVYHMMRQAERNNLHMATILDGFEKKLEFLASNDQTECPVCLEDFQEGTVHAAETLSCCHKVCKDCWTNWSTAMGGRPFCPLCRHEEFLGALAERM